LVIAVLWVAYELMSNNAGTPSTVNNTDFETRIQMLDSQKADLLRQQSARVQRESQSDDNRATARAVGTELKPEFEGVKTTVEKTAVETQKVSMTGDKGVEKKIIALTKSVEHLQKTLADNSQVTVIQSSPPPVKSAQVIVQQEAMAAPVADIPAQGKMYIVIDGISGAGEFWGPMTNWTENKQPINKGVGEFHEQDGVSILINGLIGDIYLDKIVAYNKGTITMVASNGQRKVFNEKDIVQGPYGPNLSFSFINGAFQ